jgi:carbon-monoxide dehydrogenase medium subunit
MWNQYFNASSVSEVLDLLDRFGTDARLISGGTDILLELEKAENPIELLIDVSRIQGLDRITLDENRVVHIGALVTHNQCVESELLRRTALPLVMASYGVGSPQIRNRGTIAGNVITASPANDTISPLMALNATVTLRSKQGERNVRLEEFYLGVRKTVMQRNEMLTEISFPALTVEQKGVYKKYALRRAQAISLVNATSILTLSGKTITNAVITLGSVSPTIIHAASAEQYLKGRTLSYETIEEAARLAAGDASPITDIRGSAAYRSDMTGLMVKRGLEEIADGSAGKTIPTRPVLLWGSRQNQYSSSLSKSRLFEGDQAIQAKLNRKSFSSEGGSQKTLLRWIREDAQLVGTKEGCAEGECGACTIFLDGKAVMSCLVAAPRADGAEIVTIEGVGKDEQLSPVQQAFVNEGAVQCGYCTPGFVMSAEKLIEENPNPTSDDIKVAISGNLCRCTGYYNIVKAIEKAAAGQWEEEP